MLCTAFCSFGIRNGLWGVARFPTGYGLERNVFLELYRVFGTSGMGLGGRPMPVSVPARQRRKRSKPDRGWFGIKKPVRCCCKGQEGAWLGSRQVLVWGQKESLAGRVLASDSKAVRAKSWLAQDLRSWCKPTKSRVNFWHSRSSRLCPTRRVDSIRCIPLMT